MHLGVHSGARPLRHSASQSASSIETNATVARCFIWCFLPLFIFLEMETLRKTRHDFYITTMARPLCVHEHCTTIIIITATSSSTSTLFLLLSSRSYGADSLVWPLQSPHCTQVTFILLQPSPLLIFKFTTQSAS